MDQTVEALPDEKLCEFLDRYETSILRHPNVSILEEAYFALANVYFRLGAKNPVQEKHWKEKCV
ncbi:hypothetical protein LEP1GSC036_1644 [Leptospira weilii str. 2006001853]|uniref:Tetratricopeptide repeat protein n=1 Tax=Leptospira weilii str. 2006001853 TaxID=1001589 RepID=A0A828YVU3_9LEPT|nr:hypothetical protein [Leptospira weilii]EKR62354.1 hypothetical protein LEP1GSC036_1644 [Leptospira weilii str. 2006001853]